MKSKDYLGKIVNVTMDRPLGSKHPKHGFIYPVNYGYIPNTISGDGEELDAYVLGVHEPLETFEGNIRSRSYALTPQDEQYEEFMAELRTVFEQYSQKGSVTELQETQIYLGRF